MKSILDKRNKAIGILFIVDAVIFVILSVIMLLLLTSLTGSGVSVSTAVSGILGVMVYLFLTAVSVLLSLAFFLNKRSFVIVSYILLIVYGVLIIISNISNALQGDELAGPAIINLILAVIFITSFVMLTLSFTKWNDFTTVNKTVAVVMVITRFFLCGFLAIFGCVAFALAYLVPDKSKAVSTAALRLSLEDELKALKEQYENNQISEEEYNQKKAEILAKI